MKHQVRLIDGETIRNPSDLNKITELFLANKDLSTGEILSKHQEREAFESATLATQKLRREYEQSSGTSFNANQEELEDLFSQSNSHLESIQALSDTNPSDYYSIKKIHQELKFAKAQAFLHITFVSRLKQIKSEFKQALGRSLRFSDTKLSQDELKTLVEDSLEEIGAKEFLEDLELSKSQWEKEVKHLNNQNLYIYSTDKNNKYVAIRAIPLRDALKLLEILQQHINIERQINRLDVPGAWF